MSTKGDADALFNERRRDIDYGALDDLHFLGAYQRRLPVSMARMMENAHDWAHLPHLHASSFAGITLVESGPWGWRAIAALPEDKGGGEQALELLVDQDNGYWATTIVSGAGQGVQIHTQAKEISDRLIDIEVQFFLPVSPDNDDQAAFMLQYLKDQYSLLYDEDLRLMEGRQKGLDDRAASRNDGADVGPVMVGDIAALNPDETHFVETGAGRWAVRWHRDQWLAHSAVCPHLLGPLGEGAINEDGEIVCPWHGYRFNIETGENRDGLCGPLATSHALEEIDGCLYLRPSPSVSR